MRFGVTVVNRREGVKLPEQLLPAHGHQEYRTCPQGLLGVGELLVGNLDYFHRSGVR